MERKFTLSLLVAMASLTGAGTAVSGTTMYACTQADGTIELTTRNGGPKCEVIAESAASESAPDASTVQTTDRPAAAAPVASAASASATEQAAAPASKDKAEEDPRKAHREAVLQALKKNDGTPAAGMNPAVGRRYLTTDRSGYLKALADGAAR
jgi:hypothetical protein